MVASQVKFITTFVGLETSAHTHLSLARRVPSCAHVCGHTQSMHTHPCTHTSVRAHTSVHTHIRAHRQTGGADRPPSEATLWRPGSGQGPKEANLAAMVVSCAFRSR